MDTFTTRVYASVWRFSSFARLKNARFVQNSPLLQLRSPHRSLQHPPARILSIDTHKPHADVWVPPTPHPPPSTSPCAFPKDISAPNVFSCTKSIPAPPNIPISEQTHASTFLFSKGWMNCANTWPPFSQERATSVRKWDNLWDRAYCLFLSKRLRKFQCSMAGEGLTYHPLRAHECSLCKIFCS